MKTLWLSAILLATAGCAGREIRHVQGCEDRLSNPEKRMACVSCLERPEPHEYLPDQPEGQRCVRR